MLAWLATVIGVTTIITQSKLLFPMREWLETLRWERLRSDFLSCPMCVGFWVGFVSSAVFKWGVAPELPYWVGFRWIADGCISSAACWYTYVVAKWFIGDRVL